VTGRSLGRDGGWGGAGHAARRGRRRRARFHGCALLGLSALGALAAGCGERRDVADLAVGVAPFEELRGINAVALRSGGVRAFRRAAVPSPYEGLREPIGAYDLLFEVPGFDGSDGSWPSEDALVSAIEATREWPSDTAARAAFDGAVAALQDGLGVGPRCYELSGPGFGLTIAQWDRGGGWVVTASFAPAVSGAAGEAFSARHSIAVRREAVTVRFPEAGAPNPHERPTWTAADCAPG
jgi:hypothetical protein